MRLTDAHINTDTHADIHAHTHTHAYPHPQTYKYTYKGNSFIIYNNKPVLDYINNNNCDIKSINMYDFKNLFDSISHKDIVKVSCNIYGDF